MSCQNPANVAPFLTRDTSVGHQNGKPQDQQAGDRVYFCRNCNFGPMICALYSACIVCSRELESNGDIDFIPDNTGGRTKPQEPQGRHHAGPSVRRDDARQAVNSSNQAAEPAEPHRQQLPESTEEPTFQPRIIQGDGMVTIPGQINDGHNMLSQYINSPPSVVERLANGFANDGSLLEDTEYIEACWKLGYEPYVWEYQEGDPLDQMEPQGYDFMEHSQ
ncbi:uncharacterized protein BKCO1_7300037 [Diplodia corticola]|uniref:Uncharacterized protein n=1 Tax=Diplodia corticola TaxID=236234 RepID=A0A1J9RMI1_9PEZI|nr:uncharacterized protein BKCO1_7300037 [Diplodia corticola]OJD29719.1 hypothetical protein BKCO1_7300037 [Diplodia corticola]